eukprot:m.1273760 g.1273760  ORF g.1273760 m.1273760 type:complete len:752 (-) comp24755_c1_seq28:1896-4151(-)
MSMPPAPVSQAEKSKPPLGLGWNTSKSKGKDSQNGQSQSMATKYERIRPIGRGSFGKVFLCKNQNTDEKIVAKEINIRTKTEHDEALAEAQILSSVSHVNIIAFKEVRRTGPQCLVIYMEFADDGDIDDKINRRKPRKLYFQSSVICQWLVQVCQAMDYLHSRGYIHRDVKTANMFLTKEGFVKLGDFGIAKSLERNAQKVGQRTTSTPVGTPMYIAPQICEGQPYTQKADIWSLGCCVYEMCCLRPAFHAKSMENLMSKIKNGNFKKEIPDHYPDEMHELVPMLLMRDPAKRPTIKDLLASSLMKPWLPTSPATLLAQGLTPTRYPPVVDPTELASQSTPNFVKIEHSDDVARSRAPTTPMVSKRIPAPPTSHLDVQNSSVSVRKHYNAPVGASRTPQPARRWPQKPTHHDHNPSGGGMLQVPLLKQHRRNYSDGNAERLAHDVSKFSGVSLSVATPKHKHLSHSPRTSPLSSPRTSPPSSPRCHRQGVARHHGNQGVVSPGLSPGSGAAGPTSSPLVPSSVSAPIIVGSQQNRAIPLLGIRGVETGAGGSYASAYKAKLRGGGKGSAGAGDKGVDERQSSSSSSTEDDTDNSEGGADAPGRSNSDGGARSHEYWNNPPVAKSKMRYREPRSLHTTPEGSPVVNRRLVQAPASNSLADLTRFYHHQRTHAHTNGEAAVMHGRPLPPPLHDRDGCDRHGSPSALAAPRIGAGPPAHVPHTPSPPQMQWNMPDTARTPPKSDKSPSPLGSSR